jgi:hypothetical membrane protein
MLEMRTGDSKMAGALIFVASVQFTIAVTVAEAFYPGYSISQNYISDLGATCRTTCQILEPTSTIFNSSVIILGALLIVGAYFIKRAFHGRILPILIGLTGSGAIGVGVFPETAGMAHHIFSLIAFVFAGLSALAAYRLEKPPLSYLSALLGVMTLGALGLYISNIFLGLGPGGMERMIVYPSLAWAIGFGGYLVGAPLASKAADT